MGTEEELLKQKQEEADFIASLLMTKLKRQLTEQDFIGYQWAQLPRYSIGDNLVEIGRPENKFKVTGIYYCHDRIQNWCYANGINNIMISQISVTRS